MGQLQGEPGLAHSWESRCLDLSLALFCLPGGSLQKESVRCFETLGGPQGFSGERMWVCLWEGLPGRRLSPCGTFFAEWRGLGWGGGISSVRSFLPLLWSPSSIHRAGRGLTGVPSVAGCLLRDCPQDRLWSPGCSQPAPLLRGETLRQGLRPAPALPTTVSCHSSS